MSSDLRSSVQFIYLYIEMKKNRNINEIYWINGKTYPEYDTEILVISRTHF